MAQHRGDIVNNPAFTSLLDLKRDILTKSIPVSLGISIHDINRLTKTCKTMHRFLQPKMNAAYLMRFVINSDWDEVKKIIAVHPEWMFEFTKVRDINGCMLWTSPIKYALYVHDVALQDIFSAAAKTIGKLDAYLEQASSLKRTFDFTPFKNAYEQFISMVMKEEAGEPTRDPDSYLGRFWRETIGGAQLHFFPRHMLKRLCTYDFSWGPESEYNDVELAGAFRIEDYRNLDRSPFHDAKIVDIFEMKPRYMLGVDYAVAHARSNGGVVCVNGSMGCAFEFRSLCRLIEMRQLQQEQRLQTLREEFVSSNVLTKGAAPLGQQKGNSWV